MTTKYHPLFLRRLVEVDDDSSDDKENTEDRIVVEDVNHDKKEIPEESPPEGCGHRVQTPPDYYNADFSNTKYVYSNEAEVINMCQHGDCCGAGSGTEQGFINVANQLDSRI